MVTQPGRKLMNCTVLTAWALLLTALTGVMGGVPLRGLRLAGGSTVYWLVGLTCAAALGFWGWWAFGLVFLSLVVVVGLFSELEERGHSLVSGGISAVIITTLMLGGGLAVWISQKGATWYQILLNKFEAYLNSIPWWAEAVKVEPKDILAQVPSMIVVVLIFGLFLALLFQRRVMVMTGLRRGPMHRLSRFAAPDAFIWVFIAGLAGAFLVKDVSWATALGLNLLNVAAVTFFLQGLAVVANYFETFKVGWFWQTVLFLILVTQLFVLVCGIGLADYWLDFRTRFAKRSQEVDREIFKK